MKKVLCVLMAAVMVIGLTACAGSKPEATQSTGTQAAPKDVYTITCSHATADTTSLHAGSVAFKEFVEGKSGGRIVVNIFPNAQLGGDRETIEGVQTGEITMMSSSNAVQVNFVPDAVIFDMPFLYPTTEFGRKVLDNAKFKENIAKSYAASGLHYMGASDQGFRTLTANKVVKTPEDLNGLTIRTMENEYHMATWKALGANPTPLAFNELYTALQQGTVDAQENPVELIYSQKFYEQQKYVIGTNHIFQTIVWIMNESFYQNLPDDLKAIVDEGCDVAVKAARDFQDNNYETNKKAIQDYGTEFIDLSPEELSAFSAKVGVVYDMIKKDCGSDVYESYMAAVEAAK
ncbi:MAG: TRAP transporter substrate-binding protein [Clostridia bacterium]|nr:TRAP transporter substrate-binding protein [Clostridia bacterium]MBQ6427111.1 TRAP transporter substrate-binding protein [Clostridia bacterium]